MTSDIDAGSVLQKNWWLIAIAVVCIVGGVIAAFLPKAPEKQPAPPPMVQPMLKRIQEQGAAPVRRERMTPKEKAESDIAQHRAKIEEAPDSEDAPAYWNAMGNLYAQKLGNYNEAIRCYEIVLSDFPDWPNIRGVYVKLADCYERIGETTKAQRVYRNMMRDFAPDRPEHQYAKQKLGM